VRDFLLPDFVGIGGHRCGSTWLWKNLQNHSGIWMPATKELHIFDRRLRSKPPWFSNSPLAVRYYYRRFYFRSAARIGVVRGEITPAYMTFSASQVGFVKQVIPRARVLFMMRDPVERGWSHLGKDIPSVLRSADSPARERDYVVCSE
jgi:hypothetical protein